MSKNSNKRRIQFAIQTYRKPPSCKITFDITTLFALQPFLIRTSIFNINHLSGYTYYYESIFQINHIYRGKAKLFLIFQICLLALN